MANEFIRNNTVVIAVKRDPYKYVSGIQSGWAIVYLPIYDQYGHQDGDRQEFSTEAERDAAFEILYNLFQQRV